MSIVFLYFGYKQVSAPDTWISFVPDAVITSTLTANNLVILNGILELILGIFLLIGLYTRFSALVLSIKLLLIAYSIGLSPLGIRDFALALATLSVFLNGIDNYTLDHKLSKHAKQKKELVEEETEEDFDEE